jgi:hypothetical protein
VRWSTCAREPRAWPRRRCGQAGDEAPEQTNRGRKTDRARSAGASVLFWLLVAITLPSLVVGQTAQTAGPAKLATQGRTPAKAAHIDGFYVAAEGALHIIYSDGTEVGIPKERGRFTQGEHTLTQETFSDIQLADDRRHIGWLADYMICAQSYPCSAELVIFRSGDELKHIPPPYGVMWRWKFLAGGKQIAVESGFPHGDDRGACALYDTETGGVLATFSSTGKKAPEWVQQLRSSNK